ncbi:SRPBCC family protein [Pontibacter sp. 172403-2]|uniref:SRPBCC family protein n=1 Tax=Pontibacter rufus TaxID=2791028 RepID=UPI0018AF8D34|nr:SRPBCC family protein [Pontibacter sp. 172403-2]MBF9254265.1 SRPBCC family protein [Pontibacter sp. 172403-2]
MPVILLTTRIAAPAHICFDLSRSIDLHKISTAHTSEEAVAGVTSGLIKLHEQVTWQARHFGVRQRLTSKITDYHRPTFFADEMVRGAFQSFRHEHVFEEKDGHTIMQDRFSYTSPLGFLGHLANILFLKRYMAGLLLHRNQIIREFAESGRWREILPQV